MLPPSLGEGWKGELTVPKKNVSKDWSLRERLFFRLREKGPDQCWVWPGARTKTGGYGLLSTGSGKNITAHRASWIVHNGPIPTDAHVLHYCDNPPCANPRHLFLGNHRINVADKVKKGRQLRGTLHPSSRLTKDDVRRILSQKEWRRGDLAWWSRVVGVSQSVVKKVRERKSWRHVA